MTLDSATGANQRVSLFNIAAATKKSTAATTVKSQTNPTESRPAGMARVRVRGLRASYFRSAILLKAIAVDRAPTIANVIQRICFAVGTPRAANNAPSRAKGSANNVCSILIISSVVRMLRKRLGTLESRLFICYLDRTTVFQSGLSIWLFPHEEYRDA